MLVLHNQISIIIYVYLICLYLHQLHTNYDIQNQAMAQQAMAQQAMAQQPTDQQMDDEYQVCYFQHKIIHYLLLIMLDMIHVYEFNLENQSIYFYSYHVFN